MMRGRLPEAILGKKKQGFAVPVGEWLRGDLRYLLEKTFDKRKIEKEAIFDYNYIDELLKEYLSNPYSMRKREVWSLFMFEMWYECIS